MLLSSSQHQLCDESEIQKRKNACNRFILEMRIFDKNNLKYYKRKWKIPNYITILTSGTIFAAKEFFTLLELRCLAGSFVKVSSFLGSTLISNTYRCHKILNQQMGRKLIKTMLLSCIFNKYPVRLSFIVSEHSGPF